MFVRVSEEKQSPEGNVSNWRVRDERQARVGRGQACKKGKKTASGKAECCDTHLVVPDKELPKCGLDVSFKFALHILYYFCVA